MGTEEGDAAATTREDLVRVAIAVEVGALERRKGAM